MQDRYNAPNAIELGTAEVPQEPIPKGHYDVSWKDGIGTILEGPFKGRTIRINTTDPAVDPPRVQEPIPGRERLPPRRWGWIGFDLDGTLAHYDGWTSPSHIGEPIEPILQRLKFHLNEGSVVRIFTARCYPLMYIPVSYSPNWTPCSYEESIAKEAIEAIREWCKKHVGEYLEITCVKDYHMYKLYDDRCVQVVTNSGSTLTEKCGNLLLQNDDLRRDLREVEELTSDGPTKNHTRIRNILAKYKGV